MLVEEEEKKTAAETTDGECESRVSGWKETFCGEGSSSS